VPPGLARSQDVKDKLEELHADLTAGISAPVSRYTVGQAVEDWLRDGLDGRSEKTVTLNWDVLKAVVDGIGKTVLRELTAQDVHRVLTEIAATRFRRGRVVPVLGAAHDLARTSSSD
jgi:hypothetical protein